MAKDWVAWHEPYDEPGSRLRQRLALVQGHIRVALDTLPPGPIRVVSMCAGQGRDLLGVLADHPRQDDVVARLVEMDATNADQARLTVAALGLASIEVVEGDASSTTVYAGAIPADLVLACGVFGNVSDDDIRITVEELPGLCMPGAIVVWTRYPRDAELLPTIDGWFREAGFEPVALDVGEDGRHFGVGVHRLTAPARPYRPDVRLFTFLDDPTPWATGS